MAFTLSTTMAIVPVDSEHEAASLEHEPEPEPPPPPQVSSRKKMRDAMRNLKNARFAATYRPVDLASASQKDLEQAAREKEEKRRAALPPQRQISEAPRDMAHLGAAEMVLIDRQQEEMDKRYAVELLEYEVEGLRESVETVGAEIGAAKAEHRTKQTKLQLLAEELVQHKEDTRDLRAEFKIREELGAGRTIQMLEQERDRLDQVLANIEQQQRMLGQEVATIEGKLATDINQHELWEESLSTKENALVVARDDLREAIRVMKARDTMEKELRDAEVGLRAALERMEGLERQAAEARVAAEYAQVRQQEQSKEREACQRELWDAKRVVQDMARSMRQLEEGMEETEHRIGDAEALAKGQEEFIAEVGQKLSQQKEELGWRSKLKSDPEMIDSIKQNIFDVEEEMIGHRKLMKAAFFKRSELFRTRTKLAKEQTEVFRVQQPHTANESRLEKAFNALEREGPELHKQFELSRLTIGRAETELVEAKSAHKDAMYKLKEEQRALAKKAADAADLERRRATVRSEAGTLRAKMAAELKAETDAENARLAAIEAAIQLEADEKARTERARSKVAAEQAAAAKKREELEKLIAIAKFEARRYTIGQRVRVKTNGQVGTVANIKIEGATGLGEDDRPGLRVQLDAGGNVFLDASAVAPFDYGRAGSKPVALAKAWKLDKNGLRPFDGHMRTPGVANPTMGRFYPELETVALNQGLGRTAGPLSPQRRRPSRDFQNISRQGGGSKSKSRRQSGGGLASSVSRLDRMSASMGRLDMMSLGVDISRPPSRGPLGARGRHEPAGALSPLRQPSERFKRGHSNPTQLSRRWTAPGPALLLTGAPDALLDQLPW